MASQRVVVATIAGDAADIVAARFQRWHGYTTEYCEPNEVSPAVDEFADQLIAHAHCPPVVYFSQWIDLWSMGDLIPGLGNCRAAVVAGIRFQACCHTPPVTVKSTTVGGAETQETRWLKRRIKEAENAWVELAPRGVIVVLREPLGGLVTDEELAESLHRVPAWLALQAKAE